MEMTPRRLRLFMAGIDKPSGIDGCWLWTRGSKTGGYGAFGGLQSAHCVAYEWMVGPVPAGFDLDHLCRNKRCVNPHHLEPVTKGENVRRGKELGPWQIIKRFCINGHPLIGANARFWSTGTKSKRADRCAACYRNHEAKRRNTARNAHAA